LRRERGSQSPGGDDTYGAMRQGSLLKQTWLVSCFAAVGLVALCGCADVKPTRSGYLKDYSALRPAKEGDKKLEVKRAPAEAVARVDSFYIEDVAWRSPRPKGTAETVEKQEPVLAKLREALREELSKVKPVVDRPGERTARVRAAVTDAVNAHVILNIIMTIIAVPVSNGGATVEAEVLSPDGGRQVAAVDFARPGGLFDVVGYYWPDDHAKQACRKAAVRLREAVEGKPE
jgi:hypothetical protein